MGEARRPDAQRTRYDTSRIADMVDIEYVALSLGLEVRHQGPRGMILCPCHNDKHMGSCFLLHGKDWHCYSCGAGGDAIKLVQKVHNISFLSACEYIAALYGESEFVMDGDAIPVKKVLRDDMLRLIGIPKQPQEKVAVVVASFWSELEAWEYIDDLPEEEASRHIIEWSPITEQNAAKIAEQSNVRKKQVPVGIYLVKRVVVANPLQYLRDHDEDAYNALIARKAKEASHNFRVMAEMPKAPESYYQEDDPCSIYDYAKALCASACAANAGYAHWSAELRKMAAVCDDLVIEHSFEPSRPVTAPGQPRKRIAFGKIRTGTPK